MDPFQKLPNELLLMITTLLPDLVSLRHFVKASRHAAQIVDSCGAEIVEAVLKRNFPHHLCNVIRAVAHVRSCSLHRYQDLTEFLATYFGKLRLEACGGYIGPQKAASPIRCSAHVVRGLLESAYQIHCLTHACLQYYLDRFNRLQPSHLIDKRYRFGFPWSPRDEYPAGERFLGAQDYGPPTLVEELRVSRAFWAIQLFYDMQKAAPEGTFPWQYQDIVARLSPDTRINFAWMDPEPEEIKTCLDYIRTLQDPANNREGGIQASLPWPPREVKPIRQVAAKPDLSLVSPHLDQQNLGSIMEDVMRRDPACPLNRASFDLFRRFGFAIWVSERMDKRGFAFKGTGGENAISQIYFAWRSILSEQELAELDG